MRPTTGLTPLAASRRRRGIRPARFDPAVPIEDTIGAIADLVKTGYVRYIALSEVDAETIRRAAAVHPIVDLQIGYSLLERRLEGSFWIPAGRWALRLRPTACSRAASWADTSTPIWRLKITATSASGFRERTCVAISISPNGCVRSRLLCTRRPHRRRSPHEGTMPALRYELHQSLSVVPWLARHGRQDIARFTGSFDISRIGQ